MLLLNLLRLWYVPVVPLVAGEELGKTAGLDLLLEEVELVEKHDKWLALEVDVVHDGGEQVQALVHPVGLIVLVKKLKIQMGSEGCSMSMSHLYREENNGLYVVARNFFLLFLNCSVWLCLGPA